MLLFASIFQSRIERIAPESLATLLCICYSNTEKQCDVTLKETISTMTMVVVSVMQQLLLVYFDFIGLDFRHLLIHG
jgi:hypothetical protein